MYVAMTRAREKLILGEATGHGPETLVNKIAATARTGFRLFRQKLRLLLDLILKAVLSHPPAGALRAGQGPTYVPAGMPERDLRQNPYEGRDSRWACRDGGGADEPRDLSARADPDGEIYRELQRRFAFGYPFEAAARCPAKVTVTELKGRLIDREQEEEAPREYRPGPFRRPAFLEEGAQATAAERGTAVHGPCSLLISIKRRSCPGSIPRLSASSARASRPKSRPRWWIGPESSPFLAPGSRGG